MATKKKLLQIKVIFDTNAIFNGSSSDILTKELTELILKYATPTDIKLSWHLPDTVLNERRFQMRKRGAELLPNLTKLEKLLGHNLGITSDIIETKIDDAISKTIKNYNIEIEKIAVANVNWENIINCSVFRLPPFEDSTKEKGFRDALILESALQIINASPTTPSVCRIFLITNDKLLTDAFNSKTVGKTNTQVLASIEELESQINILDSQIQETLVTSLSKEAEELLYSSETKDSLYYREKIHEKITSKFDKELSEFPPNTEKRENVQWWISAPGFVKKIKQRIYWKSVITVDAKATKTTYVPSFGNTGLKDQGLGGYYGFPSMGIGMQPGTTMYRGVNVYGIEQQNDFFTNKGNPYSSQQSIPSSQVVTNGKTKFEIIWSVTLTTAKTLRNPKIEEVNFIETIWT